jgi:hypothetical protein
MKTTKFLTQNGYVIIDKKGNTYLGTDANKILSIFIQKNIKDINEQIEILNFAVKNNRLIKEN